MPFDGTPPTQGDPATADLILRAVRVIRWRILWTKGVSAPPWRRCALTAAYRVAPNWDQYFPMVAALNKAAQRHGFATIWELNDDPATTHAFVLRVMREAAAMALVGN